jgi:cell division protein FtsW
MSTSTSVIGDRRRLAHERALAARRHPSRRGAAKPAALPSRYFYILAAVLTIFVLLGLVMVMSASSISEVNRGRSPWRIFQRQAMWAGLGLAGLWATMRVPLSVVRASIAPILVACFGLMFLPFVPGIGLNVNGARAWVEIGQFTFQPSEFLKLAVLMFSAHLLAKRESEMHLPRRTLFPVLVVGGVAAGFCLAQGDLGSAIVLAAIVFTICFIGGAPLSALGVSGAVGALSALGFALSTPYRRDRFTAFLDIAAHKDYLSYQTFQAMIALANGGWTGQGVGRGASKLGDYLPLAYSDFIFAVIAEELGFLGVFAVVGGFMVMAYCGMQVALAAPDRFSKLVAGGVVSWFVVQAVINIGGVIGLMPVTGLTLPFFSAGGSSLFATMTATGLLLNVARTLR